MGVFLVASPRKPVINSTHSGMGVCPYAAAVVRSMLQHSDAAGIILTTSCDQMRRQAELLAKMTRQPVFLLHVPTAVEAPTALPLYREEILRLGRFLETCGGNAPTPLAATMARYDVARNKLRASRNMLRGRSFSTALMRWQRGHWSVLDSLSPETTSPSAYLWHLLAVPCENRIYVCSDEIEAAGGQIVFDATTTQVNDACRLLLIQRQCKRTSVGHSVGCLSSYSGCIPTAQHESVSLFEDNI